MAHPVERTDDLVADALGVASDWREEMDLATLVAGRLGELGLDQGNIDVVALGKSALEMAAAADAWLGARRRRRLVVTEAPGAQEPDVLVGEHPVPGRGSLAAGRALLAFLEHPVDADATLFLVSGGASSLCALPAAPLTLADVTALWDAALAAGVDITTLNQLRAATSAIAGGAVLGHVRTPRSLSLILVDNVISGAPWVASALTYDYAPDDEVVATLLARVGLTASPLARRLRDAAASRTRALEGASRPRHENTVLAEPATLLGHVRAAAARRGYRVIDLGSRVHGDVDDVARGFAEVLRREVDPRERVAVVGVGEVTLRVDGNGRGGRCQELAWRMAPALAELGRPGAFVARASDGRDFLEGVAGGWVDTGTLARAGAAGLDAAALLADHDTFRGLDALGQLVPGGHTGWNLCDVYVAVVGPAPGVSSSKSGAAKAPPT